jgi:hypothetical protein
MRARNIKPGFFRNDELAECSLAARLLFIGMWTLADREGRLEDRPGKIKFQLLPTDQFDAEEAVAELAAHGFLLRYDANGQRYIQVMNWNKHQNPHIKEAASTIPAPCEHDASTVLEPDEPGLIPRSLDSLEPTTSDAREDEPESVPEPVDVEATETERKIVVFVKRVPGMANVPEPDIVLHLRECNELRGPFPDEFVLAEMQKWSNHWIAERSGTSKKQRFRQWRNSVSNWF